MFHRNLNPSFSSSFFIFGQRGVGKSTFLKKQLFKNLNNFFLIDLLLDEPEQRYNKSPDLLINDLEFHFKKNPSLNWIIIDEIQKVPKLLDIIHSLIVNKGYKFILTGSSARKLKRSGANLLAGRAFWYQMFPLTESELKNSFDLQSVLTWGSLPQIYSFAKNSDKILYLKSYVKTYLQKEILEEQVVRNIDGFRNFLEIAAQMNGKHLNFSKIARESGIDSKTVKEYFQILEDTLIGFWLPAFHRSVRKAQTFQPKFYFYDLGVIRALTHQLESTPVIGTSQYGQNFESFIITEIYKYNSYSQKDYKMSHYLTTGDQEIDLILTKGKETILIEVKSTSQIDRIEVQAFARLGTAFNSKNMYYISQDKTPSLIDEVQCLHFKDFFKDFFGY